MAGKSTVTEAEYLRTSFPGVDQEFHDGELVERSMPDDPHSQAQGNACAFFVMLRKLDGLPFHGRPELRHQVRPGRYLIPDVAVYWPNPPQERIPSSAPLIALEILSPDDRMGAVLGKLQEYVDWGVPHVWLIDPENRQLSVYDGNGLHRVPAFEVPASSRSLTPADLFD